jgi:hypothetical protein
VHSSSEEHGHLLVFVVSQVKKRAILFQNKRFQRRIVCWSAVMSAMLLFDLRTAGWTGSK